MDLIEALVGDFLLDCSVSSAIIGQSQPASQPASQPTASPAVRGAVTSGIGDEIKAMYEGRDVVRRVRAFLEAHPDATLRQVCKALRLERHTVHRKLRDGGFKSFLALKDAINRNRIIEVMTTSRTPEIQDFLKRLNCSRAAFQRLRDRLMRRGEWPHVPD